MIYPTVRTIQLTHFGREKQPVIVIDNFLPDPDVLIDDAAMLSFCPMGPHYPGVRAVVPPILVERFLHDLVGLIADTFGITMAFSEVESWYSIVTKRPEALTPIQRLPHFDSGDPNRIALLLYLARSEQGGTSFFRHRATGLESVAEDVQEVYAAAIEADVSKHGLPDPAYIAGDTPMFERIAHYQARFNRAIIYRGNTLHCADIPPDMPLPADPERGRLTVNSFINGRPAPAT